MIKETKAIRKAFIFTLVFMWTASTHSATYFIHNDHIGTAQVITDDQQNVVWQANYLPFGEVEETASEIANNSRFVGQYEESDTGYYYNYYRDYDPTLGRYIQSDPIGLAGGLNTYTYVGGKPIRFIDPFGLLEIFVHPQNTGNGTESRYQFDFNPLSEDASDLVKRLEKLAKKANRLDPSKLLSPDPAGPKDTNPFSNPNRYWECGVLDDALQDEFQENYRKGERLTRNEAEDYLKNMFDKYPSEMSKFYDSPSNMLDQAEKNARDHWWNKTFYPDF